MNAMVDRQVQGYMNAQAVDIIQKSLHKDDPYRNFYIQLMLDQRPEWVQSMKADLDRSVQRANAIAKAFRENTRAKQFPRISQMRKEGRITDEMAKSGIGNFSKAQLDVGTLTNFASITGGQSLGYVSLDTQMARGTVRPNSFTMYQALPKSAAFQVVDYWSIAQETGAGLPGTAFQGFSNVASGTLSSSAGVYALENITLKLAVNGRSITTALAAQNSFVDITAQENINAALAVLESINWACYWGNPTYFANQFIGIGPTIASNTIASGNIFDFQTFSNSYASGQGWSSAQTMFNLIYEAAAQITGYRNNGRITHAFMSPICAGALQGLVTTLLNNITNRLTPTMERDRGIIVDGDLQGIRTRFGEIQFPIDLFITARDKPAQAIVTETGTNFATTTAPTRPVSVAPTVCGVAGSWTSAYTASSGQYGYAVASCDSFMNESTLTYLLSGSGVSSNLTVTGVGVTTSYYLTITGPVAADATAFRIYRSGLGYTPTAAANNPAAYRYIGTVLANGSGTATFLDQNTQIPGGETVFLLDMDEGDNAIDYRFLLPLTKIELFAQNLFMPWAVCSIGSIRLKVPKFHGYIKNFVPDNPDFNPLAANTNAT